MDLITVIIPVYNVEKYLDRCVDSVVNQTYKNLEIILVDDGSVDNSPAICEEWAKKDKRIIVIHKHNGGLSSARNFGIDNSNGKYLYFIDSDDYIVDDTIETLYGLINSHNADMAFGRFKRVYEDKSYENELFFTNEIKLYNVDGFWCDYYKYREDNNEIFVNMTVSCNKLIKATVFSDLRFDIDKINEDVIILLGLISCCEKIVFTDKLTYYYFQNNNGIMSSNNDKKNKDVLNALAERTVYFIDNNKNYAVNAFNEYFWYFRWFYFDNRNTEIAVEAKKEYKDIYRKIKLVCKTISFKDSLYYFSLYFSDLLFKVANTFFNL